MWLETFHSCEIIPYPKIFSSCTLKMWNLIKFSFNVCAHSCVCMYRLPSSSFSAFQFTFCQVSRLREKSEPRYQSRRCRHLKQKNPKGKESHNERWGRKKSSFGNVNHTRMNFQKIIQNCWEFVTKIIRFETYSSCLLIQFNIFLLNFVLQTTAGNLSHFSSIFALSLQ